MNDKSKWKAVPLAVSVFYEGNSPLFGEAAYHVSVDTEGGGPFVTIQSHSDDIEKGRLELDIEALQLITDEAEKLIKIHEEFHET